MRKLLDGMWFDSGLSGYSGLSRHVRSGAASGGSNSRWFRSSFGDVLAGMSHLRIVD
jgi:hypothetical protein